MLKCKWFKIQNQFTKSTHPCGFKPSYKLIYYIFQNTLIIWIAHLNGIPHLIMIYILKSLAYSKMKYMLQMADSSDDDEEDVVNVPQYMSPTKVNSSSQKHRERPQGKNRIDICHHHHHHHHHQ